MKRIDADAIYDENVDYDALEQHTYADSGKHIFILVLDAAMNIWLHLSQKRIARQCVLIVGTGSMDE